MRALAALAASATIAAATSSVGGSATAQAETFDSAIADTRTMVGLRANVQAVEAWIPEGWEIAPIPEGPLKGTNLLIIFIDRLLHQDPSGEPKAGGSYRMAVLAVPAKNSTSDEGALFIPRSYGPHDYAGPYKTAQKSDVRRDVILAGANIGPTGGSDAWSVESAQGGALTFRMEFEPAVPKRVKSEVRPRSTVDPSFFRIYRSEQLIDFVKSAPAAIDRVSSYELTTTIDELEPMFDGSEQVIGIAVIPWYTRQTFLP